MSHSGDKKWTPIFAYGTLKRGFANHDLMLDIINQKDAIYNGEYMTHKPYPLVCGPFGIPYLINLSGSGNRVRGELYSVSDQGLRRLDELEGTSAGHYNRLPIRLIGAGKENSGVLVDAECYFADGSFGEKLWRTKGLVGLSEFTETEASECVRKHDREGETSIVDEVRSSVFSGDD